MCRVPGDFGITSMRVTFGRCAFARHVAPGSTPQVCDRSKHWDAMSGLASSTSLPTHIQGILVVQLQHCLEVSWPAAQHRLSTCAVLVCSNKGNAVSTGHSSHCLELVLCCPEGCAAFKAVWPRSATTAGRELASKSCGTCMPASQQTFIDAPHSWPQNSASGFSFGPLKLSHLQCISSLSRGIGPGDLAVSQHSGQYWSL